MTAPNEGTTNLPSDAGSRYFVGGWDGAAFRALRSDSLGQLKVALYSANGNPLLTSTNPGIVSVLSLPSLPAGANFIGTVGVTSMPTTVSEGVTLSSGSRVGVTYSTDQLNSRSQGVIVFLSVTAHPGDGQQLGLALQAKSSASGDYRTIADAGYLFTAETGLAVLMIGPGISSADAALNTSRVAARALLLPRYWRVMVTPSGVGQWTYGVGHCYTG